MDPLAAFSPATRAWFEASFEAPTEAQSLGWPAIHRGEHTLIHAPTGSGKTLAAFLWAIDRLHHEPTPSRGERCRVLYVSPAKALAYDIERNLRAPLIGIRHAAARTTSQELPALTSAMRTGDTEPAARQRMARHPPDILITTPESLYLMLTSQARRIFGSVRWVIVDEVHAIAGTKRGAHLALSLERLEELAGTSPQRIGLSATQRPLSEIAQFLGGGILDEHDRWQARPVAVVDAPGGRNLDIELIVAVDDMAAPAPQEPGSDSPSYPSIWPAVYPRILELIEAHRSTIVFANSRRLAERICAQLNELAGEEVARSHHGSVSREQRVAIEESLKRGELRAVVATSSLELGIDMGSVDLVIQVESPTSVASGLQRVGRSGHQVGGTATAKVFPKYRADLLEAAVVVDRMSRGLIETTKIPTNPLDVLAQHVVAAVAMDEIATDDLYRLVRRAAPFRSLGRKPFDAVLEMLAGRYPSDLFSELRPRLTWDRVSDTLRARPGSQMVAVQNPGTIPDRGYYPVVLPDGTKIGELDEEMVYESRVGDAFILGATTWRIAEITPDRVEVVPSPADAAPRMPFWHGDSLGRPAETGKALGEFIRRISALDAPAAERELVEEYRLNKRAAKNLLVYLEEEREATGTIPSDRTIVVERFRDEIGDWRLVILSPYGARVHAPWAMALTQRFRGRYGHDVDVIWADDGIAFRFADADDPPGEVYVDPEDVESLLLGHLAETALFQARFREAAARALLLPRRRPGKRTPLWLQRRKAADLHAVASKFGSFPIVLETFRETLQDDFDLPSLHRLLSDIRARKIRLVPVDTRSPSPFASSLLFDFVAAFLYEGDAPLAERKAAALSLDRELLAELLGEEDLRELIAPEVTEAVELELQWLTPQRASTTPEAICDLLRDLGPLTEGDLQMRSSVEDLRATLEELEASRRIIQVGSGERVRWAAIEDAGRLRDAQGMQPPPGVPSAYLEPVADPLGDVVGRFARTHGPFPAVQAAEHLSLAQAVIVEVLGRLESEGRVVRGAFSTQEESEWVDTEVLRRLKRRTLAALRSEIEPVSQAALGRFLPEWHGVGGERAGTAAAMRDTVRQLQGASLPASILERDALPARLDYSPELLDHLMATGDVVWAGAGSLGPRDGRIVLCFHDQLSLLGAPESADRPETALHEALRSHLSARGASFFRDLYQAVGGGDPTEVLDGLWDLVWAGEVTNDTLAPLRSYLLGRAKRSGRAPLSSSFPPSSSGRWSLLEARRDEDPTREATARTLQLLERHGIVARESVRAEGMPGGFSGIYPILRRLEETGRVRRGYFVEGLGAAQFALPGAVDRLRSEPSDELPMLLASADPANPYGAALAWPETPSGGRPSRTAGSYVFLWRGSPVAFLERGARTAMTFTDQDEALRAGAVAMSQAAARNRRLRLETVDGEPAYLTGLGKAMADLGFTPSYKGGLVLR